MTSQVWCRINGFVLDCYRINETRLWLCFLAFHSKYTFTASFHVNLLFISSNWTWHAPRACTASNTPSSQDILVTASHISYVNYWLTHICPEKIYSKNQQCSCILANHRGPGWNVFSIYKERQYVSTAFKNYQPVLVARKIHITPICKKRFEKLYITEWLNL